jgi:saccharopine dehydrogenase (NAD+, L-glutamate forming)
LLHADIADEASMRGLAESTKVVITTVGPYVRYGEPVVAACAAAGTDYVDLTGEPEFVDLMWLRHHAEAERSGARLVHSCGFDSIPYDLGALFTVEQLPRDVPIELQGFVSAGGTFSGGTYHSAIHAMGRLRESVRVARERRSQERNPVGRRIRGIPGRPHNEPVAGGWVVPFPTIDPQTVLRSARALDRYGPDFSYSHYLAVKRLPMVAGLALGAGCVIALAQLPPTRQLLLKFKDPGQGPTPEQRAKAWFRVRFLAKTDGQRLVTQVSGGDPGYGETSKMLAQSALCLAHDDLPETAGQLTPAVAMGDALSERLQRAGIRFEVVEH